MAGAVNDVSVFLALIGIVGTAIAAVVSTATISQKRMIETQAKLVSVLESTIAAEREEKKLLGIDNREQAQTIAKMGTAVDKLTDRLGQFGQLLETVVYGREDARRRPNQ